MKIRWTKNSVRLRITPEELGCLRDARAIDEAFAMNGDVVWRVCVAPSDNDELNHKSGVLMISISPSKIAELAEDHREGVYFSQGDVRYYIEKDFPCAHPRAGEAEEVVTETFAPPPDFEARKNP